MLLTIYLKELVCKIDFSDQNDKVTARGYRGLEEGSIEEIRVKAFPNHSLFRVTQRYTNF